MGRRDMLETRASLKGHTTVFVSTHILADVERVCDHVAIINRGRLVTMGSIDELRSRRQHQGFELELEDGAGLMEGRLAGVPWVISVDGLKRSGRQLFRVDVSDIDLAKKELPRLVYESGVTLLRYELASASLEDVFIQVMEEEEVRA